MTLPSLPLDVLLVIFRDLTVVDIVRVGTVSPPTTAVPPQFAHLLMVLPLGFCRLVKVSTGPQMTVTFGSINSKSHVKRTRRSGLPLLRSLPSLHKSSKHLSPVL